MRSKYWNITLQRKMVASPSPIAQTTKEGLVPKMSTHLVV